MIEVKNRSEESWGPLANCDQSVFAKMINDRSGMSTKERIKNHIKKQKKLKKYKIHFIKETHSDYYEIEAESEYDVTSRAQEFFKQNQDTIEFVPKPRGKWAGDYAGFDRVSFVKVR